MPKEGNCYMQMVGFMQPMAPTVWKTLLKLINSSLFAAKATLISAIASCEPDTWQPKGVAQLQADAIQPYVPQLLGQVEAGQKGRCARDSDSAVCG